MKIERNASYPYVFATWPAQITQDMFAINRNDIKEWLKVHNQKPIFFFMLANNRSALGFHTEELALQFLLAFGDAFPE